MKRLKFGLLFILAALVLNGCSSDNDDDTNFQFITLKITEAQLPESFVLNETYEIQVSYEVPNGCTDFYQFNVVDLDTTVRNIGVIGAERIDLDTCPEAVTEQHSSFNFIVLYNQPYTFRFYQGQDSNDEPVFLEITVPVI